MSSFYSGRDLQRLFHKMRAACNRGVVLCEWSADDLGRLYLGDRQIVSGVERQGQLLAGLGLCLLGPSRVWGIMYHYKGLFNHIPDWVLKSLKS